VGKPSLIALKAPTKMQIAINSFMRIHIHVRITVATNPITEEVTDSELVIDFASFLSF